MTQQRATGWLPIHRNTDLQEAVVNLRENGSSWATISREVDRSIARVQQIYRRWQAEHEG
jgi:hypothetical protein